MKFTYIIIVSYLRVGQLSIIREGAYMCVHVRDVIYILELRPPPYLASCLAVTHFQLFQCCLQCTLMTFGSKSLYILLSRMNCIKVHIC